MNDLYESSHQLRNVLKLEHKKLNALKFTKGGNFLDFQNKFIHCLNNINRYVSLAEEAKLPDVNQFNIHDWK